MLKNYTLKKLYYNINKILDWFWHFTIEFYEFLY